MEQTKYIVVRTPPFVDESTENILNQTITELEQNFPDRKVVKIPANFPVEFIN